MNFRDSLLAQHHRTYENGCQLDKAPWTSPLTSTKTTKFKHVSEVFKKNKNMTYGTRLWDLALLTLWTSSMSIIWRPLIYLNSQSISLAKLLYDNFWELMTSIGVSMTPNRMSTNFDVFNAMPNISPKNFLCPFQIMNVTGNAKCCLRNAGGHNLLMRRVNNYLSCGKQPPLYLKHRNKW